MDAPTTATPFPNWKFVVFRTTPRHRISPDHQLATERAIARRRQAGPDFDLISNRLYEILNGNFTKARLMSLAGKMAAIKGVKVDRDAKRVKDSLICWFCEHCKDYIMTTAQSPPPPPPPTCLDLATADPIPQELWDAWEKDFPFFE
jgi:hypothetical protein